MLYDILSALLPTSTEFAYYLIGYIVGFAGALWWMHDHRRRG